MVSMEYQQPDRIVLTAHQWALLNIVDKELFSIYYIIGFKYELLKHFVKVRLLGYVILTSWEDG